MRKVLLLASVVLSVAFFHCGGDQSGMDVEIAVPVSVVEIQPTAIEEFVSATGTVYAANEVELNAETNGYYRLATHPGGNRPLQMGDHVKKGQVIVHLDDPELENSIRYESQQLNLEVSKNEYEKQQSLYEKGGVTFRELKNAEISFIEAKYSFENAELQLAKTRIIAPFDGIIVDIPYYTPGTRVPTSSLMVKLMDYKQLYLELSLPGKEMPRIHADQEVRVMNYTVPDDTLHGAISQVSPALDPDSRAFKASVKIHNPDFLFRPGMFVQAEVIVAREDSALVVPRDIIMARGDDKRVFVVEKGAADERRIVTGIENPLQVQVLEGLQANERLVVQGFETLRDRSKVKIIR